MADSRTQNPRIEQLTRRLEMQPGSRVFLQLAEEHRRAGSVEEAIAVLRKGLDLHPDYLSAKVALGRSLLEAGEGLEAHAVLQDVLAVDSTHLVASKLLVEAHLLLGNATQARRQLELYRLMNSADPQVSVLAERIDTLQFEDAAAAAEVEASVETEAALEEVPEEEAEAEVGREPYFASDLPFPDLASSAETGTGEPALADEGIFDLAFVIGRASERAAPAAAFDGAVPSPTEPPDELEEEEPDEQASSAAALGFESIDDLTQLSTVEEAAPEPSATVAEEAVGEEAVVEQPGVEEPLSVDLAADDGDELPAVGAAADATAQEPSATPTLGALYLRQGHLEEAERIFRQVLEQRPEDVAARRALAEIEARRAGRLTARDLLGSRLDDGDLSETERKKSLLEAYLHRLQPRSEPDVP